MDFIVELPESGGYNAIIVVVDSVGHAHFMETVTTITAAGATNLYVPPTHLEAPRSPLEGHLGLQPLVCCCVHERTLLATWNQACFIHRLPPTDRWPDRTGQPGVGTVHLVVHERRPGQLELPHSPR